MKRLLLITLVACGSSDEPAHPAAPVAIEPAAPKPAPGLDLSGPIAGVPETTPAPRKPAVPLDLAADRAIVKVAVPIPPRGGAVGFTFADDRPGWVAKIPDGQQLPAVAYGSGRVYVSGGFQSVSFYALDALSGRIEWATTALEDNGPTAAVIEDGHVLFNTESCTLFALDAKTGKREWFRYLGDPTLTQVAVVDGVVYAAHPENGQRKLSAFTVKSGAPVWSSVIDEELLATPVIAGDSIYASTAGGMTYRFLHRTGKLVWAKPLRATTAPWIVGDELFVTRRAGNKEQQIVVATDTGKVIREHRLSAGSYAWDVPSTSNYEPESLWAFEGSRPVVDRGIHYVAMGNDVIASDAKSGEALWNRRYKPAATAASGGNGGNAGGNNRTLGSVALAGSTIVVSSRDGKVFGLDVDTGFTLWSYDIGHRVAAEPIIAEGWLYSATTDGYVVALDVADKSLDGWHMFGGNAKKNGTVTPPVSPPPIEGKTAATSGAPATADSKAAELDAQVAREAQRIEDAATRAVAEAAALKASRKPYVLDPACLNSALCRQ